MKYLSILLFPSFLMAAQLPKVGAPQWFCDGYVKGYDENIAVIEDRWQTVKTFKIEGPTSNTNVASTEVTFDKHKANVSFVFNQLGSSSMFDETVKSEGVSLNVSLGEKSFGGDSFQVMDSALPKMIGLRVDFELDKKTYIVRLICKKNKKGS